MTRLSVNINKIATIRNARGGNLPDVKKAAVKCESFGADGITVHPRPDERHIRYQDVREIRPLLHTEYNIEGFPSNSFITLIKEVMPEQVTLVPDSPEVLTSSAGWDTLTHFEFLKSKISVFREMGIRTSIFVEADDAIISKAAETHTDRIELYTEAYAKNYRKNKDEAIEAYVNAAETAQKLGLGINAGHDLNLENLEFFNVNISYLKEVSIGHALISDALYFGLSNTIQMYQAKLIKTEV